MQVTMYYIQLDDTYSLNSKIMLYDGDMMKVIIERKYFTSSLINCKKGLDIDSDLAIKPKLIINLST